MSDSVPLQALEAFVWSDQLVTGLDDVDDQHHHLVDLINRLGGILAETAAPATLKPLLGELAEYTDYHFRTEEALMREVGVAARHQEGHLKAHAHFKRQVGVAAQILTRTDQVPRALVEQLLEYLTRWLVQHIMGTDTRMAHEIKAIRTGMAPEAASRHAAAESSESADVLLDALNALYAKVGEKTLEVLQKNQELEIERAHLEERVRERTAELEQEKAYQDALIGKLEEAHNQLLQSEKMASIGQLAAGVAHEINNPVGFVNSNLTSLGKYIDQLFQALDAYAAEAGCLPPDARASLDQALNSVDLDYLKDDIPELLRESRDGLDRVKRIIQDLKDFSHVDESTWQEADLEAGLDSTLNVVWNELKYKAEVSKDYAGLPRVTCMPSQLNQVFMNLLVNAAQAIPERGRITLRTGREGDDRVWIEIEDSGQGMPPEVVHRIFEPFYTTKPVGQGTGLGLSVSYGIVAKHQGRIEVHSTVGQGTRFRVWLPIDASNPTKASQDT